MNRNGIAIAIVVLVVGALALFIYSQKQKLPKHRWDISYDVSSDEPYGLKMFYSLMKKRLAAKGVIHGQEYYKLDSTITNSNLVYIGDEIEIDSVAALDLLRFVERGNNVLLASNSCPMEVIRKFVPVGDSINYYDYERDSVINVSFGSTSPYPGTFRFHYQIFKDTVACYWSNYAKDYFKTDLTRFEWTPLSFFNDSLLNGFYFDYGEGRITISTTPLLFTNFYMTKEGGYRHANNFLAQLHEGPVYWNAEPKYEDDEGGRENPLQFLFSHLYLRWGWYLVLITILLYLFFRSKREQRIIPLMPVNVNASIEYTKAIGTLYFQSTGHQHIAHEMYMIFLNDVRTRYNISTDIAENELIEQLSLKSGVNQQNLFYLFKKFKQLRNEPYQSDDALIKLYEEIENYHQKRK